ncbi:apolipoprotein N-acyltransferase [Spongorhabdus nitratireducens]
MLLKNKLNLQPGDLLAPVAGLLMPLAFSPFDYWPLALICPALLFLVCLDIPVKTVVRRAALFGLGLYSAGVSWVYVSIHVYGMTPPWLAVILTALFVLTLTACFIIPPLLLFGLINRKHSLPYWHQALIFSGLWILAEWSRSWLFTGFPWLQSGYALLDTPFQSLAPVIGVYGLSLLLLLVGTLVISLLKTRASSQNNKPALALLVGMGICGALAIPLNSHSWTQPEGKPVSFAAVQGNISQNLKWEPGHFDQTVKTFLKLSEPYWGKQLLIWPENALPVLHSRITDLLAALDRRAQQRNTALFLGLPYDRYDQNGHGSYYNAMIGLGEGEGLYLKRKLVPFGEYVPMQDLLRGVIDFFNLPMSNFRKGPEQSSLLQAGSLGLTTYICYEVAYPDFAAEAAKNSGALLTVSNDTWFGDSIGPQQHLQLARMRALETGRPMIRATNDGITALIDRDGKVLKTTPRFEKNVLTGDIQPVKGETPFMRFGSIPVLLLSILLVLSGLIASRFSGDTTASRHTRA